MRSRLAKRLVSLITALALSASLFPRQTFAQQQISEDSQSLLDGDEFHWMESDQIYQETMRLCSQPGFTDENVLLSPLFNEIFQQSTVQTVSAGTVDLNSFVAFVLDKGNSQAYRNLIEWPPFNLALERCFPNNPRRQQLFVSRFFAADMAGRAIGIGVDYGIWKAFGRMFDAFKKWAPKMGRVATWGMWAGVVVGLYPMARTILFGPTQEEIRESKKEMEKMFLEGPRKIDLQDLQLYDAEIRETEEAIKGLNPMDAKYKIFESKLERLRRRREIIAKRIEESQYSEDDSTINPKP